MRGPILSEDWRSFVVMFMRGEVARDSISLLLSPIKMMMLESVITSHSCCHVASSEE